MRSLIPSEAVEQRALVRWLSFHPILKNYFCKNNNEGERTGRQGRNLQLLGLRSGVSDLFIYYPTASYAGLWLEIKRNRTYAPSERRSLTWIAQESFLEGVKGVGYAGYFCFGWEEGKTIIEHYLET